MKTAKQLGLTPTQHRNLAKLTLFVRDKVAPPKFNIEWFFTRKGDEQGDCCQDECPSEAEYNCGSAACFLGYGILAGIKARKGETWEKYSKRTLGINMNCWTESLKEYNLLFHNHHKNGKTAAIKRGAYFLMNGLPEAENLMEWEAPRSFKPDWTSIKALANS